MALAQGRVPVAVSNVREHARVYPARTFSIVALGLISAMYFFQGSSLRTKPRTEITPVAVESLTLDAAAGDVIVSVGTRLKKRMGIRDALGFVALHFAPSGSPVAVGDVPANSGGASNVVVETSANAGAGVAPDTPTPTQSPGETTTPLPTTSPASTVTSSETVSPAGTASGSTSPAPVAAATVPPSISELISRHELFTPSTGRWRVAAATGFFGGPHPWSRGSIDCPGGCQIEWFSESERGHEDRNGADIRMIHDNSGSYAIEPLRDNQLIALWASETFDLADRGDQHYNNYHTELSYRSIGFYRDGYMSTVMLSMRVSVGAEGPAEALKKVRSWADVFPPHVSVDKRRPLSEGSITFASSHCNSASGREDLVRAILARIPVTVVGSTCLRNAPDEIQRLGRTEQRVLFSTYKFHLAFENHACVDYVTEKSFNSLLYGQVPIIFGAPNIAEHLPAGSYINVNDFASVDDLISHLRVLDSDPVAYERYHAWRTEGFETFGLFFRRELLRWIAIAHYDHANMERSGGPDSAPRDIEEVNSQCFRCAMCYSLNEWGNVTGWRPPFTPPAAPPPRHIPPFRGSCSPRWNSAMGRVEPLPGFGDRRTITAAEFYASKGALVPAAIVDARLPFRAASGGA